MADEADEEEQVLAFTIRCEDGDFEVTEEKAGTVISNNDYFRSVFEHGTTEARNRVIIKPDWTRKTAASIVFLLFGGWSRVKIGSVHCQKLFRAMDQIQVVVSFADAVGAPLSASENQVYMTILSSSARQIEQPLKCRVDKVKEKSLLSQGILVMSARYEDFTFHLGQPEQLSVLFWGESCSYSIFSQHTVPETVCRLFDVFGQNCSCSSKGKNRATLFIKFKGSDEIGRVLASRAFSSEDGQHVIRFVGSLDDVYDNLRLFQEDQISSAGLIVKHPDSTILSRLLEASRCCESEKIGMDLDTCTISLPKKSPADLKMVLRHVTAKREVEVFQVPAKGASHFYC